jgi:hypothetical protein
MLLKLVLCALLAPACTASPNLLASTPLAAPADESWVASEPSAAVAPWPGDQHSWAGISNYYLWSCNATVRTEALDAVRAAGLKVIRVFLVSTTGGGAVGACADTPTPDLEPTVVGTYVRICTPTLACTFMSFPDILPPPRPRSQDDTILQKLDVLLWVDALLGRSAQFGLKTIAAWRQVRGLTTWLEANRCDDRCYLVNMSSHFLPETCQASRRGA